jgi:hypothetical protein
VLSHKQCNEDDDRQVKVFRNIVRDNEMKAQKDMSMCLWTCAVTDKLG